MAYTPKDMSGVLFKNTKKNSDKAPDYTGNILIHGQKFQLAAWVKTAKSDAKFLSIAVKDESDQTPESDFNESNSNNMEGDLPF